MEIPKPIEGLRELIESLRRERSHWDRTKKEKRREKTDISHRFANALKYELGREGLTITPLKDGNANFFYAEIGRVQILISPFASQEEWWQRPSDGFMNYVREVSSREPSCRWGIILFRVPDGDGVWVEGAKFEKILEWPEKFTKSNVKEAIRKKVAREFSDRDELIYLIRNGPDSGPKLIRRRT